MLLLDTHTFLWFEDNNTKLPEKVKEEIETNSEVFVSIASFWEMAVKNSIGKLNLTASVTELMEDCAEFGFAILPINGRHLDRLTKLPWTHRDPFDRLLICQAQEENLTLVTADATIKQYDVANFWQ